MNTGLQEIHCLSHKFRQILKSPESAPKLLEDYNKERKQFVTEILNTANKYYKVSLNIAKHLGLNVENYFSFKKALDIAQPFVPPQLTNLIWKYGVKVKKKKKKRKRTNIYFFSIYFPLNLLFISYIDCPG